MILEGEGRREEHRETPPCDVLGSSGVHSHSTEAHTEAWRGTVTHGEPRSCLLSRDLGCPRAPAVCRAPPSPGRETTTQDPMAEPQDQDSPLAAGRETEAKGGGPNLWGCEFPTFSPSSPGHSHLCLEGRGGPRGQKQSCPGGPQLEGILGWLPGHLRPCPAPFCPCGCVNSRGPPVPQKVGALTVLFVEAGQQARRLRISPRAHSWRLLWSEQTSTAHYILCYGNTSPSGRLKGLQSLSPDGPDSGTRPACCLF